MSVTVSLNNPIVFNGQSLSALTFREPTVGDLVAASEESNAMKQTMTMLARLCGLDRDSFWQVSASDLNLIAAQTKAILGNASFQGIGSE